MFTPVTKNISIFMNKIETGGVFAPPDGIVAVYAFRYGFILPLQ